MLFRLFYCHHSAQLWRFVHFGAVCGGFLVSEGVCTADAAAIQGVGTTGRMVPSALNSRRSMHTSRCVPGESFR